MRSGIILTLVTATLLFASNAFAQGMGIYSGRGIPDSFAAAPEVKKSRWPKLLDFGKDDGERKKQKQDSNPYSARMPFESYSRNTGSRPFDSSTESKPRRKFSDLFANRDPNRPNLLEQMNSKSKDLFDRTADWAQRTNQGFREKSLETWDAITRRKRENGAKSRGTSPARPPIRTTEHLGEPAIRY